MIDPRLITLRTLAACGTVAATADLTGYSPSAISAQLRELQKSLGVQLVTREGRGVRLTAAGRHLVAGSDDLLAEWEQLRASTLNADGEIKGHFGVGGFSTAAAQLLAPLAASLRTSRPNVRVQLVEASPQRCFEMLVAERIDLAVIVAMQSDLQEGEGARFEQIALLDDPLDVVVPASHPLADRARVNLEELALDDWITDAPGSPYRALFTAAFAAVGVSPRIAHESQEWETMTSFVVAGLGVGFLPRLATLGGSAQVRRLRLIGPGHPTRRIVAAVRHGSLASPLIDQSLEYLRATARRILAERLAEES